jgi:ketosteroid isomerase-like protein
MAITAAEGNIVQALRQAHEERDVELALSLYSEHAEVRVFDHANPPDSPKMFRGTAQIAEYLARLYDEQMSHHVGSALQDVVSGEGRVSFNVTSESKDRTNKRVAAHSYEVHKEKIVYQTNVEAS